MEVSFSGNLTHLRVIFGEKSALQSMFLAKGEFPRMKTRMCFIRIFETFSRKCFRRFSNRLALEVTAGYEKKVLTFFQNLCLR